MRISDWSSDVCSSDLGADVKAVGQAFGLVDDAVVAAVEEILQRTAHIAEVLGGAEDDAVSRQHVLGASLEGGEGAGLDTGGVRRARPRDDRLAQPGCVVRRSEEHTSELQSLMRISYAVFCLKKKKSNN